MNQQRPQPIRFQTPIQSTAVTLHVEIAKFGSGSQRLSLPVKSMGFERLQRLGRALLIIDGENITYNLNNAGWNLDYATLLGHLQGKCDVLEPHVFTTAQDHAVERVKRYYAGTGIAPHVRYVENVLTANGQSRHANSDNELLLQLGYLCAKQEFDTVVLATGDGALGCSAINFLAELRNPPRAYTCSVMGATSPRLLTENNSLVNGNLWIGQDILRPRMSLTKIDLRH